MLIGNVSAEDNLSDVTVEDSVNKMPNDIQNFSEGNESIARITGEDTGGSSVTEDIVFEDIQKTQTEKKSSPGFELMVVMIAFLSTTIITIRIRRR